MAKKVPLSVSLLAMDVQIVTSIEGEDGDTKLKTVCIGTDDSPHDPVRTNQVMRCGHCNKEASSHWGFPTRAHENEDGTFTPLTPEQMEALKATADITGRIGLTSYPVEQVEAQTVPYGKYYYAIPQKTALRMYASVREGIRRHLEAGKVFCTMYAPSTAASMYRIGVSGDLITLQELAKPEQVKVRPAVDVPPYVESDVQMFLLMAGTVHGEFDPALFADQRKAAIAKALEQGTAVAAGESGFVTEAQVAALSPFEQALEALRAAGGLAAVPDQAPAPEPAAKAPRKRAPRKAPAKVA